jgi:hypothetical protein
MAPRGGSTGKLGVEMQLAIQAILALIYVQALVHPVWALAALLIVELAAQGYVVGTGLSVRLAAATTSAVIAAPAIVRALQAWDPSLLRVFLPTIVFVVTATVAGSYFSEPDYVFKYFRLQVIQIVTLLVAAIVIRDRRTLKIAVGVALAVGVASAILAIVQQVTTNPLAFPAVTPSEITQYGRRSVGLTRSPVSLANDLTFVMLPVLGLLLVAPVRTGTLHVLLGAAFLILLLATYATFTRSALLGIGPGLVAIGCFVRGWRRSIVIGILVGTPLLYVTLEGSGLIGGRLYAGVQDDPSAASHLATAQVGLELALDNWITGLGHEGFEEESTTYANTISGTEARRVGRGRLGEARAHNDFMNVWFSWGIVALVAYLAVFAGTFVNFMVAARSRDWLIQALAIGCAGGLATYAFSSALHNYLDASNVLWFYAGFSAALVRLTDPATTDRVRRLALLRGLTRVPAQRLP